jgi:hypothetical protein
MAISAQGLQVSSQPPGPGRKRIPKAAIAVAGVLVLGGAGAGIGIALSGGSSLTASPAQIAKDLNGYTTGSPLPIYVIKHVQVNGTPKDNGTTETANITITWGLIPGATTTGQSSWSEHAVFTLTDKTKDWTFLKAP